MDKSVTKPKTILHVLSGRSVGGAERVVIALVQELLARGYNPVLACRPGAWVGRVLRRMGVPVEWVPMRALAGNLFGPRRIRSVIRKHEVDLVHTHLRLDSSLALPAAAELGVPSVCTVHGTGEDLYCEKADAVIAVSQAVKDDLVNRGLPEQRIDVVLNGISVEPRRPTGRGFRDAHGFKKDDILVGAVSRLVSSKGFETLIRAAALCPDVKIVLVGYGRRSYRRGLRRIAEELGLGDRLFLYGRTDDPRPVLEALDAFVMPSVREGLGVALIEAAAVGIPIVASEVGGIPEIVRRGETGLLFPPGDADALARALTEITSDRDFAVRLSDGARRLVSEEFTATRMADGVENVYLSVLDAKK